MYGYFDPWELLWSVVLPVALVIWLVSLIVRWIKRLHNPTDQVNGVPAHHLTGEEMRQYALGFAITVITPLFLYFLEKTLLPGGEFSQETSTFQFGFGVGLGLVVFILGLMARRVPVVGVSLATGGLLYLITIVSLHFPGFEPVMKLLIVILGLLVVIAAGYVVTAQDTQAGRTVPTLSGIKSLAMGFLAFLFSGMVIINAVATFTDNTVDYNSLAYDAQQRTIFMITLGLSIVFLILGLLIKVVRPIGWGLLLTGLLTIFYTLFASFDTLGGTGVVLITGLGLVVLIYFAYHQFATSPAGTSVPPASPPSPPMQK
ncbi:MAG: hypothetical protein AAB647_03990 [Patescibacteria group bacterium]